MIKLWGSLTRFLKAIGDWIGFLGLRLLLGWEFFESGLEKHRGENWFLDIQDKFPAPFNLLPTNVSWSMATWFELVGGVAIVVGLGTRFFAVSLFILTVVATAAVHWPAEWHTLAELLKGYAITDDGFGNFKLPLLFMAMLIPLILYGPGKLSLDAWIARCCLARV